MSLNILFLAAEAEPFIKIGGLGDVAGALPEAVHHIAQQNNTQDIDIRLVLPYHYAIKQKNLEPKLLGAFNVPMKSGMEECQVYQSDLASIPVYLLDGEPINQQSPVYSSDPIHDGYKFVFFSLAALWLSNFLNWQVDILHGNDWHTATAIYALNKLDNLPQQVRAAKTVHTLHNLPYMGFGVRQALLDYGLPLETNPVLPEWARQAPLPLGLLYADRIVAVSPHYAEEILTPEFGCGLVDFLETRKPVLTGILNGLDTHKWDPQHDPALTQTFSIETLDRRSKNKTALQEQFGLPVNEDTPLLTLVSRMDPQKGIDLALHGLRYCDDEPWQAILLGTGDPRTEDMARELAAEYPERIRAVLKFDNQLAHQLYAGADLFMMPSRYEPCGLSQMIAMRYGCVPVARATGGLVDTIKHISHSVNGGTGFLFDKSYPSAFARTLTRALRFFNNRKSWKRIQMNGMQKDFSWENSALKYISIYQDLMAE
jgi:starch synthase